MKTIGAFEDIDGDLDEMEALENAIERNSKGTKKMKKPIDKELQKHLIEWANSEETKELIHSAVEKALTDMLNTWAETGKLDIKKKKRVKKPYKHESRRSMSNPK